MTFLKDCPQCGMTVAAHCECPICKTDLTNLPYSESRGERYKLNKYFWPYFFKKSWFFICCFLLILLKIIVWGIKVKLSDFYMVISLLWTSLFLLMAFEGSMFPNRLKGGLEWIFTDSFLDMSSASYGKYVTGFLALLASLLW